MASFFEAEKGVPENQPRKNYVFMAYPFTPALPAADYRQAVQQLQDELPIRFWYFLDEHTTAELMRKIWRAIIRADFAVFDTSGGNPNVAFELGLAVAHGRRCVTMLKSGSANPLGGADLGYSERIEYDSIITLKEKLVATAKAKSSGLALLRDLSYQIGSDQPAAYAHLLAIVMRIFKNKSITRAQAKTIANGNDGLAGTYLAKLREGGVTRLEGSRRGSKWVFTDLWVHHDHEVSGEVF